MSVNCRLSCDRCQYVSKALGFVSLPYSTHCSDFSLTAQITYIVLFFLSSISLSSIVRVQDANDIKKYIDRQQRATEGDRQARREARQVQQILAGEL